MMVETKQPLSNIQMELLRLYATGISDEHLLELKQVIAQFLREKARQKADAIWEQKGYSEKTVKNWLNKD
jgi:hypothetical protein